MDERILPPPFVNVQGIANFRDIGDDKLIRRGLVYRSAMPAKVTESGLQKMGQELGIKAIFDLRSTPEIQRDGAENAGVDVADEQDPFAHHGMKRHWTPVFAAKDYGPEQVGLRYQHYTRTGSEGFVQAYRDILIAGSEAYARIFRYLAASNPTPCLVHCSAGKDRTGVLVALLFMLVGKQKEEIGEEYSLTDLGLEPFMPMFVEALMKNPALQGNRDGVMNMVGSKKENMLATVDMIEKEFGGSRAYMRDHCGLDDGEIDALRKNLGGK